MINAVRRSTQNIFDGTIPSSETINVNSFHWIYNQIVLYRDGTLADKANSAGFYRKLELAVGAYNELLHFLVMLDGHSDDNYRKLSSSIKSALSLSPDSPT